MEDKTEKRHSALESIAEASPETADFLMKNGKTMIITVAIALAVAFGVYMHFNNKAKDEYEARKLLMLVKNTKDLEYIVAKYPSTPSAPLAYIYAAKLYYDSGEYNVAMGKYIAFKEKYPKHMLMDAAELGAVCCMEARNQIKDALVGYRSFQKKYANSCLKPQAIFGEARCLAEFGQLNEARVLYENFIAANPESGWIIYAKENLEKLNKKAEKGSIVSPAPASPAAVPPVVALPSPATTMPAVPSVVVPQTPPVPEAPKK